MIQRSHYPISQTPFIYNHNRKNPKIPNYNLISNQNLQIARDNKQSSCKSITFVEYT